jgi:hypothetical protein
MARAQATGAATFKTEIKTAIGCASIFGIYYS